MNAQHKRLAWLQSARWISGLESKNYLKQLKFWIISFDITYTITYMLKKIYPRVLSQTAFQKFPSRSLDIEQT